jgi:hypothetical protein
MKEREEEKIQKRKREKERKNIRKGQKIQFESRELC